MHASSGNNFFCASSIICHVQNKTLQLDHSPLTASLQGSATFDPRDARQLWGLAVRSERALRATALLWPAQQAAWGEAVKLLENIAQPASWLSEGLRQGAVLLPASAYVPLTRLLLSCAATELKLAHVAGLQPGSCIFPFLGAASLQRSRIMALSPAMVPLLLPRLAATVPTAGNQRFACHALMFAGLSCRAIHGKPLIVLLVLTSCPVSVLLSRSMAEVGVLSQATCMQAHYAVGMLARYASQIAQVSVNVVHQGHRHGMSPGDRARLAQPITTLLRSPLLGILASLQHAVLDSSADVSSDWRFPEGSGIPPVHLMPAHMEPDAMDSEVAMQVSSSLVSPHHGY